MTPTPEQNAKRFIELSENVSVLSTTETNAVILARAYLELETELQQLRLAADGLRDAAQERVDAKAEYDSDPSVTCLRCGMADDGLAKALAAYRAAGEGK